MYANTCSQEKEQIIFQKKQAQSKQYHTGPPLNYEQARTVKLTTSDDPVPVKQITLETRKLIQSTRQSMNMSQKDLACKLNVNPSVINELESGKLKSPPPHLVQKLNNVLKLKIKLVA